MSTLSGLISAGGGSTSFPVIFLSKSQTFVPPQDGNVCIHVIGAGGSGSGSNSKTVAGGGGAGGYCKKNSLAVTTSSSFTVVIGAGHVPTAGHSAGGDGGNSTVAGTGLSSTLTANGGSGCSLTTSGTGAGGTAANGDVNNTGGAGQAKYGGGAVGLTGTGNQGYVDIDASNATWLGFGGACDVLGDLWSSSLGQIAGGLPGKGMHSNLTLLDTASANAGPLSGGGTVALGGQFTYHAGGAATIGGGGGGCSHTQGTYGAIGGRGGDGLVIFQYIP